MISGSARRKFLPRDFWIMTTGIDTSSLIQAGVQEEDEHDRTVVESEATRPVREFSPFSQFSPLSASTFQGAAAWHVPQPTKDIMNRKRAILDNIPFVVPFEDRVLIFREIIKRDRMMQVTF